MYLRVEPAGISNKALTLLLKSVMGDNSRDKTDTLHFLCRRLFVEEEHLISLNETRFLKLRLDAAPGHITVRDGAQLNFVAEIIRKI